MKQIEVLKTSLQEIIKEEYIEFIAYAYNYNDNILMPVEWEFIEQEITNELWEKETIRELKKEFVKNPQTKLDFVVEKIFNHLTDFLSEKIKEGWKIKLEMDLDEAKRWLKNIF